MNSPLLAVVSNLTRAWTWVYTWGMRAELRDARRAEIESDLWESQQEPASAHSVATQILCRTVLGLPADVSWRVEHSFNGEIVMQKMLVITTVAALLLAAIWIFDVSRARKLPVPPSPVSFTEKAPPPPPPPPPTWEEFVAKVTSYKETKDGKKLGR